MKHPLDLHRSRRRRAKFRRNDLVGMVVAGLVGGLAWTLLPAAFPAPAVSAPPVPTIRTAFGLCDKGVGTNCVVDGDTFRLRGDRIRIADIDTPETHPARCAEEARLGTAATQRLAELLNSGAVTLHPIDRDTDNYGRKLRLVEVNGHGVGETLVAEGLARRYRGRRMGWCG